MSTVYNAYVKTVDLTVRKCPGDIHAALVRRAEKRNTSLRVEAIETLRSALGADFTVDENALRRRIKEIPSQAGLSLAETRAGIQEGRR